MIDFEKFGYTNTVEDSAEVEEVTSVEENEFATESEELVEEEIGEQVSLEEVEEEIDEKIKSGEMQEPSGVAITQQPVSKKIPGRANIVVCGIGGGGCNAVNNMVRANIKSATCVVMNTDMQALNLSLAQPHCKIQLGKKVTDGLGAGSDPEIGRKAAEESRDTIRAALQGIDLLFITAGMGGGTGTGAAPVVAEIAKSMGILTVAVVTKPFNFEGAMRMKNAELGIRNLQNFVDTLLVIPNQKLIEVLDKAISFKRAFEIADDVLRQGVQGVSDVIANPEMINLDFADVRTVLLNKGLAHMGIGSGKGEKRVIDAVRGAVFSPLLETDIEGATGIILNISGGEDMLLSEVTEACDIVRQVVDPSANIIFGTAFSADKKDIEITIIATGFTDKNNIPARGGIANPVSQSPRPIETAINTVAADMTEKKENSEDRVENMFGNRPTFGSQRNEETVEVKPVQPVQPVTVQPATPQEQIAPAQPTIQTSRRNIPSFMKKLHGDRQ